MLYPNVIALYSIGITNARDVAAPVAVSAAICSRKLQPLRCGIVIPGLTQADLAWLIVGHFDTLR